MLSGLFVFCPFEPRYDCASLAGFSASGFDLVFYARVLLDADY